MGRKRRDIQAEIRDHPERFDFGDTPNATLTPAQQAQAEEMQPQWAKDLLRKNASRRLT